MTVGSSEKQKIIMQISAVQTDIKRNMEERWVEQCISETVTIENRSSDDSLAVALKSLLLVVFRDAKMKEMTVHKLEEMEKKLGETDKTRGQNDRDIKTVRVES